MNNFAGATGQAELIELDAIDDAIIALLREDGRMPYRTIAGSVGVTEATVRSRVRRLEDSDTMRLVAVTDIGAAGYDMLLAIGVQVENRSPEEVAQEFAAIHEVFSVNVVVGTHDIEILVVSRDQSELNQLMVCLSGIAGVRKLTPALAVDVLKNQPDWVPL